MIEPNITSETVFTALRSFLLGLFDCEVIQGQVNNVPMPQGSFILMNETGKERLSFNIHSYTEETESATTPTAFTIQVDFYGENAGDMCQVFTTKAIDGYGYDKFPEDIKPLYCSEPRQIPLITGEKNYLQRWSTDFTLQYNPTVTTAIDSFDEATVIIIHANGL